ncbi:MAG TPA: cupin domain-containing protein [Candidatus Marinimicrobia bacterium]|nr:cupin domain-containing protein [Candidatus Neomarinimicrobiota bacterium]
MKIVKWNDVEIAQNPHGVDARKLYDTEHAQVVHIILEPGEKLKKHLTPVDAIFYVLEGKGIVEIGNEKQEVGPDTLIDSPAKIPHCWYNESNDILRFLVIKVPRPTESTRLL